MKHGPLWMVASVSLFAIAGPACSSGEEKGGGAGGMAGTAAGSSGASGMGGSAGSSGAAGSGGTVGSGATGGTNGGSGAAGSGGSAGTGGASGSGAGGTTGNRCTACLDRQCTMAVDACEANAACTAILDCVIAQSCGEIPEPQVCIDDCAMANMSGQATFQPLVDCITGACATDCSGS